ncbi:conserved hypothetical protein [Photobacterium leiognathi lrivu.4.1]|uniref:DUF2971 domain-containing protein n=1 Tax=Photobacterium leiognathi lrivu.4.1 TaxID=1248232 RepID=V5F625_PHOLE|nr:DUF2971 domain-containing protein [Photobacterium leiognathi]GAD31408.1 conserved hypothetical protein [Photobacterium leiognathi lrivu.4.1]
MSDVKLSSLFKFRAFENNHIEALIKNELWFSVGSAFNDPFDCSINLPMTWATGETLLKFIAHHTELPMVLHREGKSYSEIKKIIEVTIKNMLDKPIVFNGESSDIYKEIIFGNLEKSLVLCLSKNVKNNVLWSHYSNWHTGFCIELDLDSLLKSMDLYCHSEVIYDDKPYDILSNIGSGNNYSTRQLIKDICFKKCTNWKYEEEYRFVHNKMAKKGVTSTAISYNENCVKAIYFGCKADEKEIQSLCNKLKNRNIIFYKMEIDNNSSSYELKAVVM